MATNHHQASDPPGVPALVWAYIRNITFITMVVAITHTIAATPVLIGGALWNGQVFPWIVLALTGWIVLYTADTVFVLLWNGIDWMTEQVNELSKRELVVVLGLVAVYINTVIAIAALFAYAVAAAGFPLLAVALAVIYPNLDLGLGSQGVSPGALLLVGALGVLHLAGFLRDVTAEVLLESLRLGRSGPRGPPGQSGNIGV